MADREHNKTESKPSQGNPQHAAPSKPMLCGGITDAIAVDEFDKAHFDEYRDVIEEKLRKRFTIPKDFRIEPVSVCSQVVCGVQYFYQVRLPEGKSARVKIYKDPSNAGVGSSDRSECVTIE